MLYILLTSIPNTKPHTCSQVSRRLIALRYTHPRPRGRLTNRGPFLVVLARKYPTQSRRVAKPLQGVFGTFSLGDLLDGQSHPSPFVKDLYQISEWSDVETLARPWHDDCMMITQQN